MAIDYSMLSNEDLFALKNNDYSKISDEGLKYLKTSQSQTETINTADKALKTGYEALNTGGNNDFNVDVDANGKVTLKGGVTENNWLGDLGKGIAYGSGFLGRAINNTPVADFINEKVRPVFGAEPLTEEQMQAYRKGELSTNNPVYNLFYNKPNSISGNIGSITGGIAPTLLLPESRLLQGASWLPKLGNTALTGLYQNSLIDAANQLADEGNINLGQTAINGGGGALANSALFGLGRLVPWATKNSVAGVNGIDVDTLEQAIKPNSQALDLNKNAAQRLLADTTERVRNTYNRFVNNAGKDVQDAIGNLRNNQGNTDALTLMEDVSDTFNQYGGTKFNPARKTAGRLEDDLYDVISSSADASGNISPIDLQKIKEYTGTKTIWSDNVAEGVKKYNNPIVEQIYGKFNNRLDKISPELAETNKVYEQLMNYKNNEGLRRVLMNGDKVDNASGALLNYNNTITKGNTGRNIQDLENYFIANGEEPFLTTIDDIKAAQDLNKQIGTGWGAVTDTVKKLSGRPVLRFARFINRTPLPAGANALYNNLQNNLYKYILSGYETSDDK